ncbi:MAG: hypothetical protein GX234_01900 [Clostridiales bacterium]|nr:hypothetical protein [Clostridiales bacterium]
MLKNTYLKKVASVLLVFTLLFGMSISACAAQKYGPCPRCGTKNYSYGYDPSAKITTVSHNPGTYCNYCKKVIPEGESHLYEYTSDKYFFVCEGSGCAHLSYMNRGYTLLYDNPYRNHKIVKVQ